VPNRLYKTLIILAIIVVTAMSYRVYCLGKMVRDLTQIEEAQNRINRELVAKIERLNKVILP